MGLNTPLSRVSINVQDANVDVNLRDVPLDVVVHSEVPIVHVVLFSDVDKVDGQNDADVLGFHTVLDVQDGVKVNLCDLL